MNSTTQIIDLDFGLSQLSGNRELLFKLLHKFANEYRQLPTQLDDAFARNDWEQSRILIHTLKGVAGNLGCNALFEEARHCENQLKNNHAKPDNMASFVRVHQQTIAFIDEHDAAQVSPAPASDDTSKQALLSALRQHEFIVQDQLDTWLAALALAEPQQQAVREAIDELDYEEAISIIEQ